MANVLVAPAASPLTDWLDRLPRGISVCPSDATACRLICWPLGRATLPSLATITVTRPLMDSPATTAERSVMAPNRPLRST